MIDFTALYRTHAGDVSRFALYLSGDPALAEDLVAETFIRLWGARERIDLATVKGYLFTIARNLFLQQRQRARPVTSFPEGAEERLADLRPGPESRALARSELRATLAALQELPEIDRAALLMRADDGLAYDEIAAALGLTVTAARVKVHRARLKLAESSSRTATAARESGPNPFPKEQRR